MKNHVWVEYLGISASAICLIHCMMVPVIMMFFPLFSSHDSSHIWFDVVMTFLISISGITFWKGYRYHGSKKALRFALVGMPLLILSLFFGHAFELSILLSILGSSFMLLAHYFNHKLCKCPH